MSIQDLIINKLEGYSGIRLQENRPLHFMPGVNLIVGRNGSGKTNLLQLVSAFATDKPDIKSKIESQFFREEAEEVLRKRGKEITKSWGEIEIVEYSIESSSGHLSISLKDTTNDTVLENIIEPGAKHFSQIETIKKGPNIKVKWVHNNSSVLKLDFGGSIHTHFLSKNRDRDLSSIIEEPIGMINEFVYSRFLEFFNSKEFADKVQKLEELINQKLQAFFGTTNKRIELYKSTRHYLKVIPILFDGENEIQPEDISKGEGALLNLIFELSSSDIFQYEILLFDEPEIHMHDDMISIFVQEIIQLSCKYPSCKFLIATHSTSLIEKLAYYGSKKTSLIVFNDKREVSNSNKDIDLINVLTRNGVWFSPLMLSKRYNLYIENQGKGESSHKNFYAKFFDSTNKPNIIPIGSGASVEQSQSFSETLQELLKSSDINSKGIRDGDIWIKDYLIGYLSGQIELDEFIASLPDSDDLYIVIKKKKKGSRPDYYFSFWEIENLYLMGELLGGWKRKKKQLSKDEFLNHIKKNKEIPAREILETFYKTLYPRPNKQHDLEKKIEIMQSRLNDTIEIAKNEKGIKSRAIALVERLISSNLTRWLPGKEIKRALEDKGYIFDENTIDFGKLEVSQRIRKILEL